MHTSELNRLRFRRQYVIAPGSIDCPFDHDTFTLNQKYQLYAHKDLSVSRHSENGVTVFLLGDIFDFENPGKGNLEILKESVAGSYDRFLDHIEKYMGRYVLIYLSAGTFRMVTDATATRKVYYYGSGDSVWLASQSHLLARVVGVSKTDNKYKLDYYRSEHSRNVNHADIGNTTFYEGIYQLIPNHYLDVLQLKSIRFWPDKEIKPRPYEEVAFECAGMIKGYMEAIHLRYHVMLPVTAGFDSRVLMAATRNIHDSVYYYINKNIGYSEKHRDIRIPVKLFKKRHLEFHILELSPEVDEEFREIYFFNNPKASEYYLPHIYNYYKNFGDRINLPGNYAADPFKLNKLSNENVEPNDLATHFKPVDFTYDVSYYADWLKDCRDTCIRNNVDIVRLFYWEERIANFGTQLQLDKDIAQEDINPFNSRLFISKCYSVPLRYNNRPDKLLSRRVIQELWPELLDVPINPSLYQKLLGIAGKLKLTGFIYGLKYHSPRNT